MTIQRDSISAISVHFSCALISPFVCGADQTRLPSLSDSRSGARGGRRRSGQQSHFEPGGLGGSFFSLPNPPPIVSTSFYPPRLSLSSSRFSLTSYIAAPSFLVLSPPSSSPARLLSPQLPSEASLPTQWTFAANCWRLHKRLFWMGVGGTV